ncbi:type II toxin-antitoxin system prevent-host-death family antitoxin [Sodalis sp. dw_96]|uniref:type II toxin-antitoxin system Phd/YefM family antitoxin n=1 Tax=Sodalis sp. dw_96 TaxID=2719794 RepID=UPI00210666FC|nr:type II toxin-antitoxin system prevent-host-death family antitoxin [Sodalis sp. dw_96]
MRKVNLHDAKTHLSKIISKVQETGETYVIARNGKPMAKIVPLSTAEKRPGLAL